ncbi:TPA: SIR2 family protein [Proteus mirabilis]|nr:SIR2 family protein [Proteus mirabilis]
MNEIYEIAYSAAANRLCLFTGTGFSKALTNNKALGWQSLLEKACDKLDGLNKVKKTLFPENGKNPLSLEEAAQVIYIEYQKKGENLHEKIAEIIKEIHLSKDNKHVKNFLDNNSIRIITTNYDKLIEEMIPIKKCQSLAPGLPIPKASSSTKIHHVHGSIDSPSNMVVTSDDYFKFINYNSYFSKKISSMIYENTIVILGYSLGDTNLKAIINEYKNFSRENVIGSSMFLVSRKKVESYLKEYYFHCYGIRVIDNLDIHDFFDKLNSKIQDVQKRVEDSLENIEKVLSGKHSFSKSFLKVENNFYEIIMSLAAFGVLVTDAKAMNMIEKIIQEKIKLTSENSAWEQYVHLANWLIYLATIIEIKDTSLEKIYLKAVFHSMNHMSKDYSIGYSWHAYKAWESKWFSLIVSNRVMLKNYVSKNINNQDAVNLVKNL